ncbi:hypothetical protein I7I53_12105 [Histoplasma capsulatum var. duboisii H88]|uniref:Uncharacterized protein n=1 Tax=Ajellomyces capsulatus (strain H88) TaxID=544711 RepID=A0A8A1LV67_AJEC8|nr:hypothetical protein I7I53_12105 [Histoplasma capsulatum var. duboisii H88]
MDVSFNSARTESKESCIQGNLASKIVMSHLSPVIYYGSMVSMDMYVCVAQTNVSAQLEICLHRLRPSIQSSSRVGISNHSPMIREEDTIVELVG